MMKTCVHWSSWSQSVCREGSLLQNANVALAGSVSGSSASAAAQNIYMVGRMLSVSILSGLRESCSKTCKNVWGFSAASFFVFGYCLNITNKT